MTRRLPGCDGHSPRRSWSSTAARRTRASCSSFSSRPEVRSGEVDTSLLDRLYMSGVTAPDRYGDIALLQAAIELADDDLADDRGRFYAFARRGRPQAAIELSRRYELNYRGQSYRVAVRHVAPRCYRVTVDGPGGRAVRRGELGPHERRLQLRGPLLPDADLAAGRGSARRGRRVAAPDLPRRRRDRPQPVAGVVVSIPVEVGDIVREGDVVAVVEAMKMESSLTAPFADGSSTCSSARMCTSRRRRR